MYEMVHVIAGVKEHSEDHKVFIQPKLHSLEAEDHPYLSGKVITSFGQIEFVYQGDKAEDGSVVWSYTFKLPEGFEGEFEYPDGRRVSLQRGENNEKDFIL